VDPRADLDDMEKLKFNSDCIATAPVLLRIYEDVAEQWPLSRCLLRGRCLRTGLYATMLFCN
jgi:hypothetical protein